ncbi:MAG: pimeloyl-ACP methyl ester carboxylesterase [Planctomycetota bacterium]|jgi:pimeloyl-ACP methyl ester carboxylesterase
MTRTLLAAAVIAALLAGCSDIDSVADARAPGAPLYEPSMGVLPVPSDLLFSGTLDLTLNPPVADAMDYTDPTVALSALAGWSTTAEFRVEFSRPIAASTLVAGDTVRLFEVTISTAVAPVGGPVTGITGEVTAFTVGLGAEDSSGSILVIKPTEPLLPATSYMLVLTGGINDTEGFRMDKSKEFTLASALLPWSTGTDLRNLQILVGFMLDNAAGQGIARDDVILANVFTTQGITDVTDVLLGISSGLEQNIINSLCMQLPFGCADMTPDPLSTPVLGTTFTALGNTAAYGGAGLADVFQGDVTLPYYLTSAANASMTAGTQDTAPLTEFFRSRYDFFPGDPENNVTRFNPLPAITGQETVPVLITLPTGMAPMGGWPVVVFQHGITRDRTDLLAIADSFAAQGMGAVAIDLPLHGVIDSMLPFFTGHLDSGLRERHFGLDLVNNSTLAPGPDGLADPSGTHSINLTNLLVNRDNLRQGHADLLNLMTLVPTIDADGDMALDFDPTSVHFVGHSLGAIVGIGAFAGYPDAFSKTFAMPGGGIPKMLVGSPSFGPQVIAGLAAAGVIQGTPEFEAFLFVAQTVTDAADPLNYASAYNSATQRVHMIEVVGDGASNLEDQTIPPTVAGAPLAGCEPLITAMGLPGVSVDTGIVAGGARGVVRFIEGHHGSILTPAGSAAAFAEMQTETAVYAFQSGTQILIGNPGIVQ